MRFVLDGKKLASLRAEKGLSQRELSVKAGCAPQWISTCERSQNDSGADFLCRIARALDCKLEDLISEVEDPAF